MKKLIIFDCDGVLVDSEIIRGRIEAQVLTELNYPISTEENIKKFTGINAPSVQKLIFQESGITLPPNFPNLTEKRILEAFKLDLKPLLRDLLKNISIQKISKCIASNSTKEHVLNALSLTKQENLFEHSAIFSAWEVKYPKPAPDLFLLAARTMGFEPKDCLVIEDSLVGIQAAKNAQMQVVSFLAATHSQYPWYQERIKKQNIPIAFNQNDLMFFINQFVNEKELSLPSDCKTN